MERIRALIAFQVLANPTFPHHRGLVDEARATLKGYRLPIPDGVTVPPRDSLDDYLDWYEDNVRTAIAEAEDAAAEACE